MEDADRHTLSQLLSAIRAAAEDPSLDWARPPVALTGGFWAQLWRIQLTARTGPLAGDLVARVMPNPDVARRETAVQAHLADQGFPTPAVRLWSPPGAHLDRAWMVMDHAPGQPLLASLSGPAALIRLPGLARSMPRRLAQHAATLHTIDPGPLHDLPGPADLLGRIGNQVATIDQPDLTTLADHLDRHRPGPGRPVVCHGDLHPFNILTHPEGDTVLDWSSALIADPACDLAYTGLLLRHPPLHGPGALQPLIEAAGRALTGRLITSYQRVAARPVDPDQFRWFTDLHLLRIKAEVATWETAGELEVRRHHPFVALTRVESPLRDR